MAKIKHFGQKKGASIDMRNESVFRQDLEALRDGPVEVRIKTVGDTRTARQNRYYWGGVVSTLKVFFNDHGYFFTDVEIHEKMKKDFNTDRRYNPVNETYYPVPASTSDLDTDEFSEYVEKIRLWASEDLGCHIMTPDEYLGKPIEIP